jgi:hypothetical protein
VLAEVGGGVVYSDADALVINVGRTGGGAYTGKALRVAGSPVEGVPAVSVLESANESPGTWVFDAVSGATALRTNGLSEEMLAPERLTNLWVVCRYEISSAT